MEGHSGTELVTVAAVRREVKRALGGLPRKQVAESARAHSYFFSKQVQKTCQFWLLTFWLLTVPFRSI